MTLKMFFTQKFWQDQTHFQVLISACFITSRKKAIRLTIFNHHLWIFEEEHCDLSRFFLNCFLSLNYTVLLYCKLVSAIECLVLLSMGPKWFWTVQIILIKYQLFWTGPIRFGHVQSILDRSKLQKLVQKSLIWTWP